MLMSDSLHLRLMKTSAFIVWIACHSETGGFSDGKWFYAILFAQFTVCIAEVCTGFSAGENPMLEEAEFLHSVCLFI